MSVIIANLRQKNRNDSFVNLRRRDICPHIWTFQDLVKTTIICYFFHFLSWIEQKRTLGISWKNKSHVVVVINSKCIRLGYKLSKPEWHTTQYHNIDYRKALISENDDPKIPFLEPISASKMSAKGPGRKNNIIDMISVTVYLKLYLAWNFSRRFRTPSDNFRLNVEVIFSWQKP